MKIRPDWDPIFAHKSAARDRVPFIAMITD
jgi:hypothetical protein